MATVLTIILGVLLRIGIPVAVTALLFFFLRRLDKRWQEEAEAIPVISSQQPCWEIKNCSEEKRLNCPAFSKTGTPCWQVSRTKNGLMQADCLGCEVFRQAPVPAQI
jgi:hypothetical protein